MAQAIYTNNITDFPIVSGNVNVTQLTVIHEPENSVIGDGGANGPYVGNHMAMRAIGGAAYTVASGRGKLETVAGYSDGSTEDLTTANAPLSGSIPNHTDQWYVVHGDGVLGTEPVPTASGSLSSSTTASVRERLRVSSTKTLSYIDFYWTDD